MAWNMYPDRIVEYRRTTWSPGDRLHSGDRIYPSTYHGLSPDRQRDYRPVYEPMRLHNPTQRSTGGGGIDYDPHGNLRALNTWEERPHLEAIEMTLRSLTYTFEYQTRFHDTLPFWVSVEIDSIARWVPIDVRDTEDHHNIDHILTVCLTAAETGPDTWRLHFVDAHNRINELTAAQALELLWPVAEWTQLHWETYQRAKAVVRASTTNQQIRDLYPLGWPAWPDPPSSDASLTALRVRPLIEDNRAAAPVDVVLAADGHHSAVVPAVAVRVLLNVTPAAGATVTGNEQLGYPVTDEPLVVTLTVTAADGTVNIHTLTITRDTG